MLLTLQIILQNAGYLVTVAESTSEALKLMQQPNAYDAVITDLHMESEHSGFEVADAAVRLNPRPIVILVTGYATDEVANAATGGSVEAIQFAGIQARVTPASCFA